MGANVEFPIGKKLFHLVLNPGTTRCPTVDLELVQTTRNVNGTRHSVRKFQPGKLAHLLDFHFFWEFSSGTSRRNVFHLPPNQKFRKFWLNGKRPLFQGSLLVIVIMIDSSDKHNCEGGFWTLRVRMFVKSAVKSPCSQWAPWIRRDQWAVNCLY